MPPFFSAGQNASDNPIHDEIRFDGRWWDPLLLNQASWLQVISLVNQWSEQAYFLQSVTQSTD